MRSEPNVFDEVYRIGHNRTALIPKTLALSIRTLSLSGMVGWPYSSGPYQLQRSFSQWYAP